MSLRSRRLARSRGCAVAVLTALALIPGALPTSPATAASLSTASPTPTESPTRTESPAPSPTPTPSPSASPSASPTTGATDPTTPVSPDGGPADAAAVYRYLENPQMLGEGQQPQHSVLRPYADTRGAAGDSAEHSARSPWIASLNGEWRLNLYNRPDDVPADFHSAGYDVSKWPKASVPHTWQSDFIDHPMFRNVPEEIWPDDPPRVPHDVNPTGAYVRTFDVAENWSGRRVFLRFEGVTSGYFVWVNGRYIGYDQGGYTPAEFDVTSALKPGANRVAVQVHRWGSGSYLEDYDQWRYSGIFRDVWLYATPQTRLRDAYITTDLDAQYRDATLTARVDLDHAAAGAAGRYTVRGTLVDRRGTKVTTVEGQADVAGATARTTLTAQVTGPAKWSADAPNLYSLVLELLDPQGKVVQTTSQAVGFREVEVRDAQVLVNGKRILIKGTNRSETDHDTGRHVSRKAMIRDVELMKGLHINAVRTSHYPSDPYFYDLANRYGLWLDDEVDIETHAHESCPSVCLASKPEWQAAFADRFQAMVQRDKNHPSIFMWDTGNEAGLGTAHFAMAEWADANEPTRLLYHQSNDPNGDAPYADVWGPRYPTPSYVESMGKTATRPVIFGEYAHAMGNGLGNFDQFWSLVRRYPSLQGGFIWDWAEANIGQPLVFTPDSSRNNIQTFLVGKPEPAPGHRGQAVRLSSLDDFVDVFRDRRLDIAGTAVTLDAWVQPGAWAGSFPILTKGQAYGLEMRDERTLQFGVTAGGGRTTVRAAVPADWYGGVWHRVTGVYDGAALTLYIDGKQAATAAKTGAIDPGLYEVRIGHNAETQQDNFGGARMGRGLVDDARVYDSALTAGQLSAGDDPASRAVLALDFDRFDRKGDFLSLGRSLSGTDGLVGSDRYVQPETAEMAWAQAPVRFTGANPSSGRVHVLNEEPATTLDFTVRWSLQEVDRTLRSGTRDVHLGPGQSVDLDFGAAPANPQDRQRWLQVQAIPMRRPSWAPQGYRYGWNQFSAGGRIVPGVIPPGDGATGPTLRRDGTGVTVSGKGWTYRFDTATGTLTSMDAGGQQLLRTGPELDAYRPPTSNETYDWGVADRLIWHQVGLDRLRTQVTGVETSTADGAAVVDVRSTVAAPGAEALLSFQQTMRYRIDGQGTVTLQHRVVPQGSRLGALPYLPRVGVQVKVPASMKKFTYYGKGPQETYNDRQSGAFTDAWRSDVDREYVRYSRPQAYGNHTAARWATLNNGKAGLLVGRADGDIDVSVTPYDELDRAEYDFQLPLVRNDGWVTLHAEAGETGMGETPNSVQEPFRVPATKTQDYTLTLRPLTAKEVHAGGVVDSEAAAPCPPDAAVTSDGNIRPGQAEQVTVTVSARCAGGVSGVRAALAVPQGWTVTPASADVGQVAAGTPGKAVFSVTAPAGTDYGDYGLTATVTGTSAGFPFSVTAAGSIRAPLAEGYAWVSDMPYTAPENGWGPVEKDQSNAEQPAGDGRKLTIGGITYDKGFGAHAVSRIVVDLGGRCTAFRADVGVDDETGVNGSVAFEVWVDGQRKAATGVLTGGGGAEALSADVSGGEQMELRITDGGDGVGNDHGDWGGARLACAS